MHDKKNAVEKREELPTACEIKVNIAEPAVVSNSSAVLSAISNAANNETTVCATKAVKEPLTGPPTNYCSRRSCVTTERMNELRRHAQEAVKQNKTFTIRGCFSSVRNALLARGWVEKLDLHRKQVPSGICQVTFEDLALGLPKRKPGETRRQYVTKCERNITSRFLEHMPIDFLWTNRKEKCDFIDQAKNPGMTINKFHRAPFTSKEGLCSQLKDFHWYYEENTAELYFPRCFNVWSPEELNDFVENFKLTACISFVRLLVNNYKEGGFDAMFSPNGKVPFSAIDFAYRRCTDYIDSCHHNDIDVEDSPRIWDHDWDAFLQQQHAMANEDSKILADPHKIVEHIIRTGAHLLEVVQQLWPQYALDGCQNLWIVKPANKCRGRGIQLMDNLKRIMSVVNPSIASKSRFVVQKYIERPLIIHNTKFDIRQWFLITNVQPLVVWMYKDSYLRFSSQEYSLSNHHESVHLTNHAIQKKYTNGKRDKRLPIENMWDCYSFQAYLRQIGQSKMWLERIYPGMRKAIVGTMLASQENMDRRPNTFELFGADFMITDDFNPWLIEINSSPDLGATTSVTARLCPQCLEDVIKVVIDRRNDPKADLGNFELIYRQVVPPTPAYMGLNLFIKGKQLMPKQNQHHGYQQQRKERTLHTSNIFRQRTALIPAVSNVHRVMPIFNATEYIERCMSDAQQSSRSSASGTTVSSILQQATPIIPLGSARAKLAAIAPGTNCPNLLKIPLANICILRRSLTTLPKASQKPARNEPESNVLSSPNKRHRSCGPRIASAIPDLDNEQHLRCISKKFSLQNTKVKDSSPEKPRPKELCNENENVRKCKKLQAMFNNDSAVEKLNRHALRIAQTQRTVGAQEQLLNTAVRSQSSLNLSQPRKSAQRRCSISTRKRSVTNINAEMYASCKPRAESSAVIHAIGKGLSPWKAARRQTARHKTVIGQSHNKTASISDVVDQGQAKAASAMDGVDQSQLKAASVSDVVDKEATTSNNADTKSTINLNISQKSSSKQRSARAPLTRNTRC